METEMSTANYDQPGIVQRLLSAIVPVLFIAIGYVDPGKWAAAVEGGARFGYDFIMLMLVFNLAAILCQYLSARIAVVTGRDLAQICSEEYDKVTCIFLGVQAELSMIALDLAMLLGTAHGLNLLLGADLLTCVFLTSLDAILFPIFSIFLDNGKAKFLCICMASFILLSYLFGVLVSQPEIQLSMGGGMLTKFSGESVFALMSLLGANVMPHNFYLHSSIVQQDQGPTNISKGTLIHDHFFAILCIFSGIFLVNYVLMNSAANVFYSTGLVLLTFQDALSLMDQVFRSLMAPFALILILMFSNHITALTWKLGGQVVLNNFFKMEIPGWLHHSIIRIIAIVPALYCVYNSGAEGIYQLLIFTQIVVALSLPSSVIPLFRVATSRSIMGVYKVSQFVEFLVLITFLGMLGLEIIFVIEMIFGDSDWASNLRWNVGPPYIILLLTASVSFFLMLWLAATPLKSASTRLDTQAWNWDPQASFAKQSRERDENDFIETRYRMDEPKKIQEPVLAVDKKSLGSQSDLPVSNLDLNLPETLVDSDSGSQLSTIEENSNPAATVEMPPPTILRNEVSDNESQNLSTLKIEQTDQIEEKTRRRIEEDFQAQKDDEGDSWGDLEEPSKGVAETSPSLTSDSPGSYRSLSGKGDDLGSGPASLSRLAGLGRAARRQLAAVLDEFWGQLFDFHGNATHEAKTKKLDVLLGVDSNSKENPNPPSSSLKLDTASKEFTGYFRSMGGGIGSDSMINASLYDSPRQQNAPTIGLDSSYGAQRGSSSLSSTHMQLLKAYALNSTQNALESDERLYSSLRLPPSSGGYSDQPATIHGYQLQSYINRMAKERNSDYLTNQTESLAPKSPSRVLSNYRDPFLGRKPTQNGITASKPPGFPDLAVPRNNSLLQPERPFYDLHSAGGPVDTASATVNAKKYHSLPDISGLALPHRDSLLSDRGVQRDGPLRYGPSAGPTTYVRSSSSSASYKAGAPLAFDELSSSKISNDPFSLQFGPSSGSGPGSTGSLWSRQPFEQFGVADKAFVQSPTQGAGSSVDFEAKLLQSFRHCIVKLLRLEGSDWLFRQNDGADEDLIDRVAAREKLFYEAETRQMNQTGQEGSGPKNDEIDDAKFRVTSVPNCGDGCIWRVDLIISFGVWCIHRVLELSLMESRPELWGKYTYVLNRLQGIIEPAFSKPRTPMTPCFCLHVLAVCQQLSPPRITNGSLPPTAKQGRGKCTSTAMLLDIIKDVEMAISCRKGRTGTAAGDVAFPKGKENLVSVLKRYKRRLSNKTVSPHEVGSGPRRVLGSAAYGS
ncbi:hypothetical protein LguiA_032291 [Lonicera macranthoides]